MNTDANSAHKSVPIRHFHFCGGSGGAALGLNMGRATVGNLSTDMICVGGIDSDPGACRDFKRFTGVEQACLDLFDRQSYRDFHGKEPPPGWKEITVDDVRRACIGGKAPNIVIISAPCKAFSRLLSAERAASPKYQALNRLVIRCVGFMLAAWADDLPEIVMIENVVGIMTRGRALLDQIGSLFRNSGYDARETVHDAGELGGLGQRRKRFLMVARNCAKVPALLYEPPKRRVLSIGEVIAEMPAPGDVAGGPMHRIPRLDPVTWLKLALIPAGKDHRALEGLDLGQYGIARMGSHANKMRVEDWLSPGHTVTGSDRVGSGMPSVADPRSIDISSAAGDYGSYGVRDLTKPAPTITGRAAAGSGPYSVADPTWGGWSQGGASLGVKALTETSATITSRGGPTNGAFSVADILRDAAMDQAIAAGRDPVTKRYNNVFRLVAWDEAGACVTAGATPTSGGGNVADPRVPKDWANAGHYGVVPWDKASRTVTGAGSHDNGPNNVADPRAVDLFRTENDADLPRIVALDGTWHRPLTTLEMAALQGFPWMWAGAPLCLDGASRARWQEHVGNAIPPTAAAAAGSEMGRTILMARLGQTFRLSATPVWVRPFCAALSMSLSLGLAIDADGRTIEVPT